jgi:mannose-6-phosphate isomerase-like protein (cupin superfamily)
MKLVPQGKITTAYGYEVIWSNTENYCGKMLIFTKAGNKSPTMIHKTRRKSWFVNSGQFKLYYTDIATGESKSAILEEGKTVDLSEMSPHQLESVIDNSIIFEVGMADDQDDRHYLTPNVIADDSQTPTSVTE